MFHAVPSPCAPSRQGPAMSLCPTLPGVPAEWCEGGSPCCHGFPASPLALIS